MCMPMGFEGNGITYSVSAASRSLAVMSQLMRPQATVSIIPSCN
jgi:hypothetical protein